MYTILQIEAQCVLTYVEDLAATGGINLVIQNVIEFQAKTLDEPGKWLRIPVRALAERVSCP
jgi:predicted HicB family RNase H-like nuclease